MLTRFLILNVLMCNFSTYRASTCELKPNGATGSPQEGGTKYRILITTNPARYNPGQTYTVTLQGKNSVKEDDNLFNGFMLSVEPVTRPQDPTINFGPLSAGIFQIIPTEANTKIDENCPNTVVHTSHILVSKIEVWWTAPDEGAGCVRFRAAVMEQNLWFQNNDGLTLELCENTNLETATGFERCCSCNEAKYEMKFEGLWTRQSHPLHFPNNMWLTRFTDVIGASHAAGYRFWRINEFASNGLIEFSEEGNTTTLESEIKSNKTRTVIKAKGVSYPNITGKTFAVFRVDPYHHLLSLISLIKPSPDWFVGISGLELCDPNCSWVNQRIIELYPFDLGLWGDLQYESKSIRLRENIHKIHHSNNPESPFYTDNTEKLKPMAKVYITKAREYERNENICGTNENENMKRLENENSEQGRTFSSGNTAEGGFVDRNELVDKEKECSDTPWGPYSECTTPSCDKDRVKVRFRQFSETLREYCLKLNFSEESILSCPLSKCAERQNFRRNWDCSATSWSTFSECKPDSCIRERKRSAVNEADKTKQSCIHMVWKQEIKCSNDECARVKLNKGKSLRRKLMARKYNVSISASYSYVAEHDTKLCSNKTRNSKG